MAERWAPPGVGPSAESGIFTLRLCAPTRSAPEFKSDQEKPRSSGYGRRGCFCPIPNFPFAAPPWYCFFVSSRLMKSTRFQPDFWGFPPNNPVSVASQPSVLSLVVKEVLFLSFTEGTTVWEPNFASISLFHSRSFSLLPTRFPSLFCFGVYHTVVGRPVCQPGCG